MTIIHTKIEINQLVKRGNLNWFKTLYIMLIFIEDLQRLSMLFIVNLNSIMHNGLFFKCKTENGTRAIIQYIFSLELLQLLKT